MGINYLTFAGHSSLEFGLSISGSGTYNAPERDVESLEIPGRSGALLLDNGRFRNITVTYPVSLTARFPQRARAIKGWLLGRIGYQRLEDTYDPDHFRLARFAGPLEWEVGFRQWSGSASLAFDCQPQRWYKSGELPVTLTSGVVLHNPGQPSSPLLRVTGNGDGELSVGDTIIHINDLDGDMMIDCDSQNAYWEAENLNANIQVSQFPVLSAGDTAISWSGGITGVICIPRWWTL